MVEAVDIKRFVNDILAKKGIPAVKNFPKEFSDGSKHPYHLTYFLSSLPGTIQHPLR